MDAEGAGGRRCGGKIAVNQRTSREREREREGSHLKEQAVFSLP